MLNSNRQYLANIFSTKLDAWNFIPSEVAEPNNIIGSINVNVDFIDTTRATLSLTPDNDGIEILLCGKFDYWYIDSFDQMPESDFMECLTTVTDNYDGVTVRETKNNGEFEVAASISLDVLTEDNIYTEIGATIAKLNEFGYDLGEELEEKDLQDYDFYPSGLPGHCLRAVFQPCAHPRRGRDRRRRPGLQPHGGKNGENHLRTPPGHGAAGAVRGQLCP